MDHLETLYAHTPCLKKRGLRIKINYLNILLGWYFHWVWFSESLKLSLFLTRHDIVWEVLRHVYRNFVRWPKERQWSILPGPWRQMTQYVWTNSSQEHKSYSDIPEHYVYKASPCNTLVSHLSLINWLKRQSIQRTDYVDSAHCFFCWTTIINFSFKRQICLIPREE